MKAEYVNVFLDEFVSTFNEVANIKLIKNGNITVKMEPVCTKNVVVNVGITGKLKGGIIMHMDEKLGKKIASNMMMGMPVDDFDEMAKSAIGELGNMMMGRATTGLSNLGVMTDITPPSVFTGEKIEFNMPKTPMLCVKFGEGEDEIEFDIAVNE